MTEPNITGAGSAAAPAKSQSGLSRFLKYFVSVLPLIGPTTNAIEGLITEAKAGATKKQLAVDSLGLAVAVAQTIDPADTAAINAANTLVSTSIDAIVALQNAHKGQQ